MPDVLGGQIPAHEVYASRLHLSGWVDISTARDASGMLVRSLPRLICCDDFSIPLCECFDVPQTSWEWIMGQHVEL